MAGNIYRVWASSPSIPSHRAFEFIVNRGRQAVFVGILSLLLIYSVSHGMIPGIQFAQLSVVIATLTYLRYRWVLPFEGKALEREECRRLETGYFGYSLLIGCGFAFWGVLLLRNAPEMGSSLIVAAAMASMMTLHFLAGSFPSFLGVTAPLMLVALSAQINQDGPGQGTLTYLLIFFYGLSIRMLFMHRRALFSILSERQRRDSLDRQYQVLMANDTVAIAISEGLDILLSNQRFRDLVGRDLNIADGPTLSELVLRGGLNPKYIGRLMPRVLERIRRKGALKFSVELHTDRRESLWLALEARLADPGSPIPRLLWLVSDITATKKATDELSFFAQHDALTGLANRYQFMIGARRAMQLLIGEGTSRIKTLASPTGQASSQVGKLAILSIDLNGFKTINDCFGHPTGDRVLVVVAKRLANALRHEDVVARFGGDEFVVLLKNMQSREEAAAVLEKLKEVISAPIELDEHKLEVGASIGLAVAPSDGFTVESLLAHADKQMYAAKQATKRAKAIAENREISEQPLLI
jgi:diguanylate cyclase (GGDEF)-like protein